MSHPLVAFWVLFLVVVFLRRHLANENVFRRAPGTWLGIVVQALGFSGVWILRRSSSSPFPTVVDWLSTLLGLVSIGLALSAIWSLGRQWSVAGRLLADHTLVASGPYRHMRHPIYTAMGGMLLATAVSMSSLMGLLVGLAVFVLGTVLRVHYEERLLRKRFGPAFETYAKDVPAFLPAFRWPGRRGGSADGLAARTTPPRQDCPARGRPADRPPCRADVGDEA